METGLFMKGRNAVKTKKMPSAEFTGKEELLRGDNNSDIENQGEEERKISCNICHVKFQSRYFLHHHMVYMHQDFVDNVPKERSIQPEPLALNLKISNQVNSLPPVAKGKAGFDPVSSTSSSEKTRSGAPLDLSKNLHLNSSPAQGLIEKFQKLAPSNSLSGNLPFYQNSPEAYSFENSFAGSPHFLSHNSLSLSNSASLPYDYTTPVHHNTLSPKQHVADKSDKNSNFEPNSHTLVEAKTKPKRRTKGKPSEMKSTKVEDKPKVSGHTYHCQECVQEFYDVNTFLEHMKSHTSTSKCACGVCKMEFTDSYELQRHMKKAHAVNMAGDAPYKCDMCDRTFSQYNNLRRHLRVHSGNSYKCHICGRTFNEVFYLEMHLGSHTGERTYKCGVCSLVFKDNTELQKHVKTHSAAELHNCDVCGKSFSKACVLRQHKKMHSGVRPFLCEICNKSFIHRHHLKIHMRMHSTDKPYACKICSKDFHQASHLYKHLRQHGNSGVDITSLEQELNEQISGEKLKSVQDTKGASFSSKKDHVSQDASVPSQLPSKKLPKDDFAAETNNRKLTPGSFLSKQECEEPNLDTSQPETVAGQAYQRFDQSGFGIDHSKHLKGELPSLPIAVSHKPHLHPTGKEATTHTMPHNYMLNENSSQSNLSETKASLPSMEELSKQMFTHQANSFVDKNTVLSADSTCVNGTPVIKEETQMAQRKLVRTNKATQNLSARKPGVVVGNHSNQHVECETFSSQQELGSGKQFINCPVVSDADRTPNSNDACRLQVRTGSDFDRNTPEPLIHNTLGCAASGADRLKTADSKGSSPIETMKVAFAFLDGVLEQRKNCGKVLQAESSIVEKSETASAVQELRQDHSNVFPARDLSDVPITGQSVHESESHSLGSHWVNREIEGKPSENCRSFMGEQEVFDDKAVKGHVAEYNKVKHSTVQNAFQPCPQLEESYDDDDDDNDSKDDINPLVIVEESPSSKKGDNSVCSNQSSDSDSKQGSVLDVQDKNDTVLMQKDAERSSNVPKMKTLSSVSSKLDKNQSASQVSNKNDFLKMADYISSDKHCQEHAMWRGQHHKMPDCSLGPSSYVDHSMYLRDENFMASRCASSSPQDTSPFQVHHSTVAQLQSSDSVLMSKVEKNVQPLHSQSLSLKPSPLQPSSMQPLHLQSSSFQPSPLQPSSMQASPLQPSSLQPSPLQPLSMQPSPLQSSSLQPSSLQPSPYPSPVFQHKLFDLAKGEHRHFSSNATKQKCVTPASPVKDNHKRLLHSAQESEKKRSKVHEASAKTNIRSEAKYYVPSSKGDNVNKGGATPSVPLPNGTSAFYPDTPGMRMADFPQNYMPPYPADYQSYSPYYGIDQQQLYLLQLHQMQLAWAASMTTSPYYLGNGMYPHPMAPWSQMLRPSLASPYPGDSHGTSQSSLDPFQSTARMCGTTNGSNLSPISPAVSTDKLDLRNESGSRGSISTNK